MSLLPKRFKAGDTVGIVSPSGPVTEELKPQLEAGIKQLETLGLKTKLARNVFADSLGFSASPKEKADDLNAMFADDSIQAIICSQGGQNANGVLPLIDYELIKKHPKIFLGISDISVLLNGIYAKTGIVTFHGNDLIWGLGRSPSSYDIIELRRVLFDGIQGTVQKNSEWKTLRSGAAEGCLLGGNITCLGKLLGTPYSPNYNGAILFLEDYGEETTADMTSYGLHHLEQAGVFADIKGLVLGYYKTKGDFTLANIAKEITDKYDFPIVSCDDFGHNTPNTVIPVGAQARLDGDTAELQLISPYLH